MAGKLWGTFDEIVVAELCPVQSDMTLVTRGQPAFGVALNHGLMSAATIVDIVYRGHTSTEYDTIAQARAASSEIW